MATKKKKKLLDQVVPAPKEKPDTMSGKNSSTSVEKPAIDKNFDQGDGRGPISWRGW